MLAPKTVPLDVNTTYGDFRDELAREGFVVIPALEASKALAYASRCQDILESFGLGYDRNDPSTWEPKHVPSSFKGGLYNRYGIAHEQALWDIRSEPEVVEAFAKIWGTDELLVSFDGMNVSVPGMHTKGPNAVKAWPHVDQSPTRSFMHCIQGIVNLVPCGPLDGGLAVMKGSRPLFKELFETFAKDAPEGGWHSRDVYVFTEEHLAWFESKGCTWHKVCAEPGDLILWDSRTCHYGTLPKSNNFRIATYVCYKPLSHATPEQLEQKRAAFCDYTISLPHDPLFSDSRSSLPEEGDDDPAFKSRPRPPQDPVLTHRAKQLAGLEPYEE